ncbi:MAG: arginine--tRNA ligase [Spirochaetota bacterium]
MILKDTVRDLVEKAVKDMAVETGIDLSALPEAKIEYPRDEKFGDYSTPVAMEYAKILRKSPIDIGSMLKSYIEGGGIIGDVEVVKPGFVNIFISPGFLFENLKTILFEGDNYGKNTRENPRRINIEFVSANPTGPLNVVSARAAAVGDTLANLLEASGDQVDREFYVNDYGNQVYLLGKSVLARYRELKGEKVSFPENGYHGEYIRNIAEWIAGEHEDEINAIETEEEMIKYCSDRAVEYNVNGQKDDLKKFNVEYQTWFHEKNLHKDGKVEDTFSYLQSLNVIYEEEGKQIFKATNYGDDKDRVVIRDDGRPTYLMADIAYHLTKIKRKYDLIIDIWGPDHHGYISRLVGAMQAMGYDENKFKILIAQQVNLMMEGEAVKMSKRLGKFSTMEELIDEVGVDVARYFFVMRSMESHLDFDLDLARRQSSENPVFYLQYAHARICSIFREAETRGLTYDPEKAVESLLHNQESMAIMKLLARFPEEIRDAAVTCEPHRMTTYLMRLAQGYHKFYTEHRVLSDDIHATQTYLTLCDAVHIVMKNGLHILGVSAPEKM